MRLFLSCLIFITSVSLSAQRPKVPKNTPKLATFACSQEKTLSSPSTQAATTSFTLINKSKEAIKIFWIQREGQGQRTA